MIENKIWLKNKNQFVIGADEVGRGSFGIVVSRSDSIDNAKVGVLSERW